MKKFAETKIGAFLKTKAPHILNKIGNVLPDSGTLGILKGIISKDDSMSSEDKEISMKLLKMDEEEMKNITARWEADMTSDSWLSKNIRPLTLAYLTFFDTVLIILDSSMKGFAVKEAYITLLLTLTTLVYTAYFGSRGLEKIKKIALRKQMMK